MGFLLFENGISLNSPGWRGTHYGDQANLPLRDLPAFISLGLRLKVCIAMPAALEFKGLLSNSSATF